MSSKTIDNHSPPPIGSINEAGFLASLNKKGFDDQQCISELIDNSLDAESSMVYLVDDIDWFKILDAGKGMDLAGLKKMYDAYAPSSITNEKKIGKAGIGGKCAQVLLSDTGKIKLYTHKDGEGYYKTIVDWGKIYRAKKYLGTINPEEMTAEEIKEFNTDRKKRNLPLLGTTIAIPMKDSLRNLCEEQFTLSKAQNLDTDERWDHTYGLHQSKVIFEKPSEGKKMELEKYNPFDRAEEAQRFWKITHFQLAVYQNSQTNEVRVTYFEHDDGKERYCSESKRGCDKIPTTFINTVSWKKQGELRYSIGMPKNNDYFNPREPKHLQSTKKQNQYDFKYHSFDKNKRSKLVHTPIIRCNHKLGHMELPDYKYSKADGGKGCEGATFRIWHCKDQLQYETRYSEDNKLDNLFGPQENKKTLNTKKIPKKLTYLLNYLKNTETNKWLRWIDTLIEEAERQENLRKEKYEKRCKAITNYKLVNNGEIINLDEMGEEEASKFIDYWEKDENIKKLQSEQNDDEEKEDDNIDKNRAASAFGVFCKESDKYKTEFVRLLTIWAESNVS